MAIVVMYPMFVIRVGEKKSKNLVECSLMNTDHFDDILEQVVDAAENGSFQLASTFLSQAGQYVNSPLLQSYRAYCTAGLTQDRRQQREAVIACQESIQRDPANSVHYLLQGRVLLLMGDRKNAVRVFKAGLKIAPNPKIIAEVKRIGIRKSEVFEKLDRNHPLNIYLGKLFSRLGLR
jgi:tetratricopeptide (TPR) repeat protein